MDEMTMMENNNNSCESKNAVYAEDLTESGRSNLSMKINRR